MYWRPLLGLGLITVAMLTTTGPVFAADNNNAAQQATEQATEICADLKGQTTPGLYGLCHAYCGVAGESNKNKEGLLTAYNARRTDNDPPRPCEEVANDVASCRRTARGITTCQMTSAAHSVDLVNDLLPLALQVNTDITTDTVMSLQAVGSRGGTAGKVTVRGRVRFCCRHKYSKGGYGGLAQMTTTINDLVSRTGTSTLYYYLGALGSYQWGHYASGGRTRAYGDGGAATLQAAYPGGGGGYGGGATGLGWIDDYFGDIHVPAAGGGSFAAVSTKPTDPSATRPSGQDDGLFQIIFNSNL